MRIETRQLIGYVVCLLAFVFIAWSFYPGIMTADSIAALSQGRSNVYGDVNAPLMSWIWGRLDQIVPGPALIFVMHLAIFWTAAALFWWLTNAKSIALGLALVLFGLLPHILAQTVVVWKDVALGVSFFIAVALLYAASERKSVWLLSASAMFLLYGYAARLNAVAAVLPIAIWSGFVTARIFEFKRTRVAGLLIGAGYFGALSVGVVAIYAGLTGGVSDHPEQQIYLYDLAAVSAERDIDVFPEYIRRDPDFSAGVVRDRYNERSVSDLIFANIPNPGDRPPLKWTRNTNDVDELRMAWRRAITENPDVYVRHRANVFAQLIGLRRSVTAPYVAEGFASNPEEFRGNENVGYRVLMKYFSAFRRPFPQTFFFRAIVWMVICVALVALAVRRRFRDEWEMVFTLAVSSLLFIAAYFPTTPSTEFRYLFWPAIASAVAAIFGFYLLRRERREQGATARA